MDARRMSRTLFRIVYNSSYTFFFIVLIILLGATPGDQIYQTASSHRVANIAIVGGTYLVTLIVAGFIYASRLYTTRAALGAIPKPYLPIEEGELGKNVRKMIVKNRQRSALVAWESRPRDLTSEKHVDSTDDDRAPVVSSPSARHKSLLKGNIIDVDPSAPPWGEIKHVGWASPLSIEFPDLHFDTVIAELPNLIEAKVVSLAPPDPAFDFMSLGEGGVRAPPDPNAIALLQRKRHQTLREYIMFLNHIKLISPPSIATEFVSRYEFARFSTQPLQESEFRGLMATFSELLVSLDDADLNALQNGESPSSSSAASVSAVSLSSVIRERPDLRREVSRSSAQNSDSSVIHYSLMDSPG